MASPSDLQQRHVDVARRCRRSWPVLLLAGEHGIGKSRLLHVYGQMRVQKGGQARERLEAALANFQRLGARKDVERVEQALGQS